jgi:hypothetical protein
MHGKDKRKMRLYQILIICIVAAPGLSVGTASAKSAFTILPQNLFVYATTIVAR